MMPFVNGYNFEVGNCTATIQDGVCELTPNIDYKFEIGDRVVTTMGETGTIVDICTCSECRARGFNELIWENDDGSGYDYITKYDMRCDFNRFYKIGKYRFNNQFSKDIVTERIYYLEKELELSRRRLQVIEEMEGENR